LLNLRKDILENPEKYEKLITNRNHLYAVTDPVFIQQRLKEEEYDYWYRQINDGRLPKDHIKYYKDLAMYKTFVDKVEYNAFNTMKLTISRLLQDFEN
jgi:hypothetical protein